MKKIAIFIMFISIFINMADAQSQNNSLLGAGSEWIVIIAIIAIIWIYQHSKATKDKNSTNSPNKSNVNLLKNIIKIAIAIQVVIIGVTIYKLVDAEAFRTYSDTSSPILRDIRETGRSEAVKSIMISSLVGTGLLWVIVFLIKRAKT